MLKLKEVRGLLAEDLVVKCIASVAKSFFGGASKIRNFFHSFVRPPLDAVFFINVFGECVPGLEANVSVVEITDRLFQLFWQIHFLFHLNHLIG